MDPECLKCPWRWCCIQCQLFWAGVSALLLIPLHCTCPGCSVAPFLSSGGLEVPRSRLWVPSSGMKGWEGLGGAPGVAKGQSRVNG